MASEWAKACLQEADRTKVVDAIRAALP
jgi:hypothetical protein